MSFKVLETVSLEAPSTYKEDMMKSLSAELAAANTAKYFDAMLAISTIYFKGIGEVSELALTTASETVGESLSAAKVSVAATNGQEVAPLQACLGQPTLARFAEASARCCEIIARSQQEAAKVLATQFPAPFMPMLMTAAIDSATETFGRGMDRFSTMGSENLAVATDALSGIGERMAAQPKRAA